MRWITGMTAATATSAALACFAPAADATFPGHSGPIAFQRLLDARDENSGQIFTAGPGAHSAHQLTRLTGGAFAPDYSPDGASIVFERRSLDDSPDFAYTMRADGSQITQFPSRCVGECVGEGEPTWTPAGDQITFERAFGPIVDDNASEVDIAIAGVDGSGERAIRRFVDSGQEPHSNQWSPDGRLIAVTLLNTTTKPRNASAIHLLDSQGHDVRQLTPLRLNAGNPDWSPDGKRIVFNSSFEGQGKVELYTVRPDGRGLRRLRRERKSYSFDPVWSPGGGRIAFVHGAGPIPHIWTVRADGAKMRQETHGPLPDFAPDWGTRR
jgi:Tol biopolymer transport system component